MIVTLDGPAGVGKTTLAKRLAQRLGVAYLDSGAMFRAIALNLGPDSWTRPEADIAAALTTFNFTLHGLGASSYLLLNNQPISDDIRTEKVGNWASNIGKIPSVRACLKQAQQAIGHSTSLVAEGRDMGTEVFPQAAHKFFLDATPEERARRRFLQLQALHKPESYPAILNQLRIRDEQDRNRPIAPLKPAPDAIIIDTSTLNLDGVLQAIASHLPRKH